MMNFESAVYVNEQLNRLMVNAAQDLAQRSIRACAEHYNFDAEEALRLLGLVNVKLNRARPVEDVAKNEKKNEKITVAKPTFPMPYNGEFNDACCYALRQNNGLYTQCQSIRKSGDFCKQCQVLADKTEGVPEYGTIQMRQAVGIFEYTDPKGRKPVAYTKVMKKYKIVQEKILEEADKFNVKINAEHFVVAEVESSKRGRPSSKKEPEQHKEAKGSKGRPKKAKKVIQIEGEGDDDDLFATLVADANSNSGDEAVVTNKKRGKSDEEKEVEKQEKETLRLAEKQEKDLKEKEQKEQKEQKKQLEDEARAAKKQLEDEARATKKQLEDEARATKKQLEDEARATKKQLEDEARATKKQLEDEARAAKKVALDKAKKEKQAQKEEVQKEEEADVVKKIEFEGKKYLKSKKGGIIYDYQEYIKNGEQVMVGKWNESKNKIEFSKAEDEESEEEYDDDDTK
jgi:hypothetical protein